MDEARAQIRKESEQYVCAKDPKAAASVEIKAKIDSRQTNCLSWSDEKESHAQTCVELVTRELSKLDECISNIDESLFSNIEADEEAAAAAPTRAGAWGSVKSCVCARARARGGGGMRRSALWRRSAVRAVAASGSKVDWCQLAFSSIRMADIVCRLLEGV